MKFWKTFNKKAVLRQLCFVLLLFVVLIPIAIWDSNTQVNVTFQAGRVNVTSDQYAMAIDYEKILSAELTELAEPGEKVADGYDNDIIRTGIWHNDTWGEYYICVDLDATMCILLELNDGRTFVFNSKNDSETAKLYETLLGYLS